MLFYKKILLAILSFVTISAREVPNTLERLLRLDAKKDAESLPLSSISLPFNVEVGHLFEEMISKHVTKVHNDEPLHKPKDAVLQPKELFQMKQRSCSCGVRNINGASRIVGGEDTKSGEFPWRVAVFVYEKQTNRGGSCGGTLISPSWVLSAAHCTMDFKRNRDAIDVYTGAQQNPLKFRSGTKIVADRFVQHPAFNSRTLDNDIVLIHLSIAARNTTRVAPACLPFGSLAKSEFKGAKVIASGWGTTKPVPPNQQNRDPVSDTLRQVELPILTTSECAKYVNSITNNQICTYFPTKDTCQGDSGSSIDFRHTNGFYYAIGIVSHGVGCAQQSHPGVYTKVNKYLTWIENTTGGTYCKH